MRAVHLIYHDVLLLNSPIQLLKKKVIFLSVCKPTGGRRQPTVLAISGLRPGLLQGVKHVLWAEDKKRALFHYQSYTPFYSHFYSPSSTSHKDWQKGTVAGWSSFVLPSPQHEERGCGTPSRITILPHWSGGAPLLLEFSNILHWKISVLLLALEIYLKMSCRSPSWCP